MNGNGTFNPQILVDKLAKLNSSQQSIETLSHWCIFHRKKARQVVETWDRQFHHSPRDQRISFLYLANDILQNSRRKGLEFVAEFWKVLPDALNDVIEKGDDFGRKAALRLVDIWEDRKVFGSRGQVLKDELLGRNSENRNSTGKKSGNEFKHPAGDLLEKILSSYDLVYDGMDEDALFGRCRTAISSIEKIEKEIGNDFPIGNIGGSASIEELKGWYNILRECVEQLKMAESSRIGLQSHLREALHEQEVKTEQIRDQLQVVLSRYEQASNILQRLPTKDTSEPLPDPKPDEPSASSSDVRPIFPVETRVSPSENKQELTPVRYTQQQPPPPPPTVGSPHTEEHRKNAAAEVAAKLAASTSSAQMLSYVLSSLASEGKIGGQSVKEDYPSDSKKPKVEDSVPPYVPPPPPPFPHPDSVNPPPPPPLPPAIPLMPPLMPSGPQFIPPAGPMLGVPYSYGSSPLQIPSSLPPYPMVGIPHYPLPSNPFHGFQTSENVGSFGQPPPLPATPPPLSRQ